MRSVTAGQRRALIQRRHHLGGDAESPEQVTRAVLALHATDPATPYLSVLARTRRSTRDVATHDVTTHDVTTHDVTIGDIQAAMYDRRELVRWMAMRRTLFVFPRDDVPTVQAAVSRPLAATLRRQLVSRLARNGSVPPIEGDIGEWIESVEEGAHDALVRLGTATGAQLGAAEPRLRTLIPARAPSDLPQNVTSSLLVVMSCEARMVRGSAIGAWTTRQHRWEPVERWWPEGLPERDTAEAQAELVVKYLRAFGPAPVSDIEWWTGWTKTAVRQALTRLAGRLEEVDLDGEVGLVVQDPAVHAELDTAADAALAEPDDAVALLPCLDPTPMGWKGRDWLFGMDRAPHYDRNGNLGPTLWHDGRIVGGWGVAATGELRVRVVADRGAAVLAAAEAAASELEARLDGAVVRPVFPTALERELTVVG